MLDQKLETLLQVEKLKSFSKAAIALNLTQPAVSQHIKSLEEEYNVKIFNRSEKVIKLTNEGEIIIKYARRLKILSENLIQALKNEKRHIKWLSVGVTPTLESNIITNVLAKYTFEENEIHIRIISDTIRNLYNKLKTYEIDVAIIEGKMNDLDFKSILLDTDYLILAVSYDNPLSKKSFVTLEELKKENLILRLPNSGTRTLFESHLNSNNSSLDEFNVTLELDNISTIKEFVRKNLGVSILAQSACRSEIKKNKFKVIPIENLSMIREINIVYHKDFEHIEILNDISRLYFNSIE